MILSCDAFRWSEEELMVRLTVEHARCEVEEHAERTSLRFYSRDPKKLADELRRAARWIELTAARAIPKPQIERDVTRCEECCRVTEDGIENDMDVQCPVYCRSCLARESSAQQEIESALAKALADDGEEPFDEMSFSPIVVDGLALKGRSVSDFAAEIADSRKATVRS